MAHRTKRKAPSNVGAAHLSSSICHVLLRMDYLLLHPPRLHTLYLQSMPAVTPGPWPHRVLLILWLLAQRLPPSGTLPRTRVWGHDLPDLLSTITAFV